MRRSILDQLMTARREGRPMVRSLDLESGEEALIDPATDSSPIGLAAAAAVREETARRVDISGRSLLLCPYHTEWEIVIVGAVHAAQALASLAVPAGYRVRVIDPRPSYGAAERFSGIAVDPRWPDEALAAHPLTARSALIALAHDPKLDDPALAIALRSSCFYVGALGSERTHARRLARLQAQSLPAELLARIRGPVGMAIGARTPAEIAIAILADLVQCRRMPSKPRIAGIVLAAGMATRMGCNKLAQPFRGKPLVRHAVEAALAARLDPVLVVTGHDAGTVRSALAGLAVRFVHNAGFRDGLSTSLQAGIAAVPPDCAGAMVLLGDMPAVTPELIANVVSQFSPGELRSICVASFQGRRGHPVLWSRKFFAEIQALRGDSGARALMAKHADQVVDVEAGDQAPLQDIDTQQELAALENLNS